MTKNIQQSLPLMPWKMLLKRKVLMTVLFQWVKMIRHLAKRPCLVFENKEIAAKLVDIHDKYDVPVDKASNNVFFVCNNIISNV